MGADAQPSEFSPASSALMAKLLPLYLDSQAYRVVLGDAEQSTHLLKRPWGHSESATLTQSPGLDPHCPQTLPLVWKDAHLSHVHRVGQGRQNRRESRCRHVDPDDARGKYLFFWLILSRTLT